MMIKHKPILELQELKLTKEAKGFLKEISKWAKFLAILGFIGVGFLVLIGFFYSNFIDKSQISDIEKQLSFGWIYIIICVVFAILFFFPNYYLIQFSSKLKSALKSKDDATLTKSLELLKSHYKFYGVFSIIMLSVYTIVFLFSFLGLLI